MRSAYNVSAMLLILMVVQGVLGLGYSEAYRDVERIRLTWFGNDMVTVLVAVPILLTGLLLSRQGSVRGLLLWFGGLGYGVYNYAFYMLGAALNVFFPLYLAAFVVALIGLILGMSNISHADVKARYREAMPVRPLGGYFVFVGFGLIAVWMTMWGRYIFGGFPLPVDEDAFRLVAALDLTIMVPALTIGGSLLWMRRNWGYIIAPVAAVQGSLYLLVLTVNAGMSLSHGSVEPPGELPIWAPLFVATIVATAVLLAYIQGRGDFEPVA